MSSQLQELAESLIDDDAPVDDVQDDIQDEEPDTPEPDAETENESESQLDTGDGENAEDTEKEDDDTDEAEGDSNDANDDTENNSDEPDQPAGLSDEELQRELERRGLKVVDKNQVQQQQNQAQEPQKPPYWEKRPKEVDEDNWDRMSSELRFIYHNLPYISVRGEDGNVYRVKTPEQLPDGFKAVDDKERARFDSEVQVQTQRAEQMRRDIKRNREEYEQQQVSQKESQEIVEGIEALIKQGVVPEIKAKLNTPEFNSDAGVVRANEIINLQRQLAQQGEKVSIVTAGFLFKAKHPELYTNEAPKPKAKTTSPADKERKNISRSIAGKSNRGTRSKSDAAVNRPSGRFAGEGLSSQQLADMLADELDD